MKKTLFLLVLFIGFGILYPRANKITFDHISIEDGLSQGTINCIYQDQLGFMWFGTHDGLNKYDGNNFNTYTNDPEDPQSISHNWIYAIVEDRDGALWIGTKNGLNKLDPSTEVFTRYQHDPKNPNSPSSNEVNENSMLMDSEGILWIGTENGLNRFDQTTNSFIRYKHDPANPLSLSSDNISAIAEDAAGRLWVGTVNAGLNKFDRKNGTSVRFRHNPEDPLSISHDSILSIIKDKTNKLWVGTFYSGLDRIDPEKEIFEHFTHNPKDPNSISSNAIYSLFEDRRGMLWVGTGDGLNLYNSELNKFYVYTHVINDPHSLTSSHILSIFEDRSGELWVGTRGGGLNKFDAKMQKFLHYQNSTTNPNCLNDDMVWSIIEDRNGIIWIGTAEGGLNRYDPKSETFTAYTHSPDNPNSIIRNTVYSIIEDQKGMLWLGLIGGVNRFDPKTGNVKRYDYKVNNPDGISNNIVIVIHEDHAAPGTFWVGTIKGLNKLDSKTGKFTRYMAKPGDPQSLQSNFIYSIFEDKRGELWIGTWDGGLSKFDRGREIFTTYLHDPQKANSISHNNINCIYEDSGGDMWLGTLGGGLNKFDRNNGTFKVYSTEHNLPNNTINGILEDNQGYLWVSTSKGLARFDPREEKSRNFNLRDGLQSYEFNFGAYCKSRTGELFFGGAKGFNRFFPEGIQDNIHRPPIVITAFNIPNHPLKVGPNSILKKNIAYLDKITLPHDYDIFSIEFAALDFTDPENNQYRCKLENFNKDWIDLGKKNDMTFANLSAGDYTLRVQGSNNDGIWNEVGAMLKIIITPPFYETWWFRFFILVFLMGILFSLHKVRTNQIKQRLEKRRLEQELKLKADFTAMLVHDLRSPLSAVIGYSEMLNEMPEQVDVKKTGQVIYRSSEKMLALINDMLDLSKFEAGKMNLVRDNVTLFEIVNETIEIMNPLFIKKEIHLSCEIDNVARNTKVFIDVGRIGQVITNVLSNAIKFAPQGGFISIKTFEANKNFLEVSVTNNGPNVPEDQRDHLFDKYAQLSKGLKIKGTGLGLAVSKLIIDAHKGEIGYEPTKEMEGSTFFFRLPKRVKESKH